MNITIDMGALKAEGFGFLSGTANKKSKTDLSEKVKRVEKQLLPKELADTFLHGDYTTYETTDTIVVYRVYGMGYREESGAKRYGAFVTTEYAESKIDAKMRLALDPRWKNTRLVEAKILVPQGQIIHVGIVAPVTLKTGTILPGGAEQILLPRNWSSDWIVGYREVTIRPQQTYPTYSPHPPKERVEKPVDTLPSQ